MRQAVFFGAFFLSMLILTPVRAQGTKDDYDRANRLRELTRGKVFRERVDAHWEKGGQRFWYRIDVSKDGWEFVVVDALKGTREAAFDHAAVAAELGKATGKELASGQIALKDLQFVPDEDALEFRFESHVWRVDRSSGELSKREKFAPQKEEPEQKKDQEPEGRRPRRGRRVSGGGTISPDGQCRALVRDHKLRLQPRKDGKASGRSKAISGGSPANSFRDEHLFWAPDSKHIVALRTRAGDEHIVRFVEAAPSDQIQPKLHQHNYLKPGDEIPQSKPHLFDVEKGVEIPVSDELFPNPWLATPRIEWAPDGSRFYYVYNQRGHQLLRVIAVDAETGKATVIVNEASDTFVDYAYKQHLTFLHETDELIWMSERDGWNHLYLYDSTTGQVKNQITQGEWVVRGVERVDIDQRQIWFRASGIYPGQDPYYIHYGRVDFDGSNLTVLTEGDGTHSIKYSPDRRFLIDTYSRVDLPPVTELRDTATGKRICELEKADWSDLLKSGWKVPERFVSKGRDGTTDIHGVIYRPSTFDGTKQYPVIEKIYAGPHGSFVPKSFSSFLSAQEVAEIGFVVVQIDGMGTSNRSKAFHNVCWKNLGDSGFPDRILWIKAATEKYPFMDLSRGVGIYGGSAGGQSSTRALLAFGDFYTVAVSDCGCHDNRMDKIWWNELWMSWPIGPHYDEQSNVTQARRLRGKLFLTVGEVDRNVDPASTMQVVDALVKAEKDFDLCVIPGAGHGVGERPYLKRRRRDFFVRHLMGVEPRRE